MKLKYFYILLATVSLGLTACEKDFMKDGDPSFDGTFGPMSITATSVSNSPDTKVEFSVAPNTRAVVLEFSTDSLNFDASHVVQRDSADISGNENITGVTYSKTYKGFFGETSYFLRMRSYSNLAGKPASKWKMVSFKTPAENLFQNYPADNGSIEIGEISLRWIPGSAVTDLKFEGSDGSTNIYPLSAEEVATGIKIVKGLVGDVTYTITLLNQTTRRGVQTIKALGVKILKTDDELADALSKATDGTEIVLQAGNTFNLASNSLTAGVTLIGSTGSSKAIVKAAAAIVLPSSASKISFNNLELQPNGYLFNQSATCSVGELAFIDCTIKGGSDALFRLQGSNSPTVTTLILNNCLVNKGGASSRGLIHIDGAGASIENIRISNSTFYGLPGAFMQLRGTKSGVTRVVSVENCTISGFSTNVMRMDGAQCNAVSATLSNTILGTAAVTDAARVATGGTLSVVNSFSTSDYVQGATYPIQGLTTYSGAAVDLFTDPANGVFSFKDQGFAGKLTAGDPRWR